VRRLFLFVLLAGQAQPWFPSNPEHVGTKLALPFLKRKEIWFEPTGSGLPLSEALFFRDGKDWTSLKNPKQLAGKVHIASRDQALALARLVDLIAPRKEGKIQVLHFEILPNDKVTITSVLGDHRAFSLLSNTTDYGCLGIVSEEWFHKQALSLPKVKRVKSGWAISRFILELKGDQEWTVHRAFENVSPDGGYRETLGPNLKIPAPSPRGWHLPTSM